MKVPQFRKPTEGDTVISVPDEKGTKAVALTWKTGIRTYLWVGVDDTGQEFNIDTYVSEIHRFLSANYGTFLGLPNAGQPETICYLTREALLHELVHVHEGVVDSPLAQRKMAGQDIVVPMTPDVAKALGLGHGPGRRR